MTSLYWVIMLQYRAVIRKPCYMDLFGKAMDSTVRLRVLTAGYFKLLYSFEKPWNFLKRPTNLSCFKVYDH